MFEKLSNLELDQYEFLSDPVSLLENLIPVNINAPNLWNQESECVTFRPYQFAMVAYDYLYANNKDKTDKENMNLKKGAGDLIDLCARNVGKSFLSLTGDALLRIMHGAAEESCIASFDEFHTNKISEPILNIIENHKFFKMFHLTEGNKKTVSRKPHKVITKHGHLQIGVNEQVYGKNPGKDFHGLHYKSLNYDETSYMSEKGTDKRVDSGSSLGYIERLHGIPDIKHGSPLANFINNLKYRNWICRLPQFIRQDWDKQQRELQAEKYGGEASVSFKLNVLAEFLLGAESKWDMERIKKFCYKPDRLIKFFEVSKEMFADLDIVHSTPEKIEEFRSRLIKKVIIDRLPSSQIIVASDIGTTGSPSEVAILFKSDKWRYEYQISLFKLIIKEQALFFKWLYDFFGNCVITLDCTNADGRAIREELLSMGVPIENLPEFKMNQNIEIDFLKNDKGIVQRDKKTGKPLMKVEYTKIWAIQQLEKIFYNAQIEIPHDDKFLREFTGFFEKRTNNRIPIWGSETTEHLHDTFLLFALAAWLNENKALQPTNQKRRCMGKF